MNGLSLSIVAFLAAIIAGCASLTGVQDRYVQCSFDHAWDAALTAVKDRSLLKEDKEAGVIETGWLEVPMEGRTFGAFRREIKDSRDRSKIHIRVKKLNDVMQVSFNEERERWVFRGGSRLFGWAPTEPSEDLLAAIQSRIDFKLKAHGCTPT
jgi:hypothetical protein